MKKAIDQTIRDLKREVNKKVLKVPGIEQKVLDATSNEPWGPHGAHLAYIAQATKNYHEYQMIMAVLWKRINDTGKNWRHVYKALIVLEYLVAHGSERVIDEIKEHAYQISTLTGFQYVDSNGRDQGNNVRKKSHSLVVLVNDKERTMEVRQKASANREKFHSASMYRAGSYSGTGGHGDRYDDDRYGYRDYDRNSNGREREWGKDDDRHGRSIDSYSRDGDRYGRDSDDRYSKYGDEYDDDRGRSRSVDQYPRGSRSRSSDGYRDRTYDDDGRYSARSSGARAEDCSQDEGLHEQKFSEQNNPPPPYEEAVQDSQTPVHDEGNEETAEAPAPKAASPSGSTNEGPVPDVVGTAAPPGNKEIDGFDPRGSDSAPPPTTHNGEMDLLGSLSDSFSSDALALMSTTSATTTSQADAPTSSGQTFEALSSASTASSQPFEDPFGESPFKATQATVGISNVSHAAASTSNIQPGSVAQASETPHQASPNVETHSSNDFGDTFLGLTYDPSNVSTAHVSPPDSQLALPDPSISNQNIDILADILPPTLGSTAPQDSQAAFSAPSTQGNFFQQGGYTSPTGSQGPFYSPTAQHVQQNNNAFGNMSPQSASATSVASIDSPPATTLSVHTQAPKKFEPKSAVWADTLSKGLVDFNISGPKANPMADIGVDFDTINRREKRERPASTTNVTSTITMGKAMGAGSGMGRAGSTSLAPHPNPGMVPGMGGGARMGMGMNMGMGSNPGMSMGMGGNPGMNMGMGGNPGMSMGMGMGGNPGMGMGMGGNPGMGMGMGMAGNPGMGMNMGGYGGMNQQMGMGMNMGQGGPMRPPGGTQPGPNMAGGNYNPTMGTGIYPQQPYGGYR